MSSKVPKTTQILPKYTVSCQVSQKSIQQDSSRRNPFQEPFQLPEDSNLMCNKPTVGSPWICDAQAGIKHGNAFPGRNRTGRKVMEGKTAAAACWGYKERAEELQNNLIFHLSIQDKEEKNKSLFPCVPSDPRAGVGDAWTHLSCSCLSRTARWSGTVIGGPSWSGAC